ncbi:MAG TPA: FKBP-type peptidyl-prolyl cis-trans isomerase, partial [Vicinamibacterales bacterium]|nr:FKBP-type peptidyl-prolyl cis-trans isomerase [Vicinamibacterales bacterium]
MSAALVVVAFAATSDAGQQQPAPQVAAPAAPVVSPYVAPPDVAAPPADAIKTKSGLATRILTPGTGTAHPKADDLVTVRYTGWSTQGKMFDSSYARGKPSTFNVGNVIPGYGEALQLMVAGEKRRAWIPEELAYKGRADRPQGMLVFDIELVSFTANPTAAPADVAAPPPDAQKTRSGLAFKVLRPGTGTVHPKRSSQVTVHYTGWTTDGKMFDSSVGRGQPATFPLDQVIPGWTEGVQLMVEGEKTRFWIPQRIAYDGQQGMPSGMLVFDV